MKWKALNETETSNVKDAKKSLFSYLEKQKELRPWIRDILEKEEEAGAHLAIWFRYGIGGLVGLSLGALLPNTKTGIGVLVNFGALFCFFLNIFVHSKILKSTSTKRQAVKTFYDYFAIFLDNAIIAITLVNWYLLEGKGNSGFIIKNTIWIYFTIPLAITIFQFRIKLVLFSYLSFLFFFILLTAYSLQSNIEFTNSWFDYNLGKGVILREALFAKPIIYLILTICISFGIYRTLRMIQKVANLEAQKKSLSRYFSPTLIQEITDKPNAIAKGKRQFVTILFSDIRKFTSFSENMDPEVLSQILTIYRDAMVNCIFENNGTLDKFIGDAVMAVFGTPKESDEKGRDAKNAISCALAMHSTLKELKTKYSEISFPSFEIGIGIHTGFAFVGNVGSENILEYTVLGDSVNTASRIESACKELETNLLISEDTWKEAGCPNQFVPTQSVSLPGKEKTMVLYRI